MFDLWRGWAALAQDKQFALLFTSTAGMGSLTCGISYRAASIVTTVARPASFEPVSWSDSEHGMPHGPRAKAL